MAESKIPKRKIEAFLKDLDSITRKHKIAIGASDGKYHVYEIAENEDKYYYFADTSDSNYNALTWGAGGND